MSMVVCFLIKLLFRDNLLHTIQIRFQIPIYIKKLYIYLKLNNVLFLVNAGSVSKFLYNKIEHYFIITFPYTKTQR